MNIKRSCCSGVSSAEGVTDFCFFWGGGGAAGPARAVATEMLLPLLLPCVALLPVLLLVVAGTATREAGTVRRLKKLSTVAGGISATLVRDSLRRFLGFLVTVSEFSGRSCKQ